MGEICILHAPETWEFARQVAGALAGDGHSVFRRENGAAGADQPNADAVIVIWSPAVLASSAMIDAARRALARRNLVPVSLGAVEPPASFAHVWPIDLSGWQGDRADPRWQFVHDEIDLAIRRNEAVSEPFPAEERLGWTTSNLGGGPMRWAVPGVVALAAVITGAAILFAPREAAVDPARPAVAMIDPERDTAPADVEDELPAPRRAAEMSEPAAPEETVPPPPAEIAPQADRPVAVPLGAASSQPTEVAASENEPATELAARAVEEPAAGETGAETRLAAAPTEAGPDAEELAEGDADPSLVDGEGEGEAIAEAETAEAPAQLASLVPAPLEPTADTFTGAVFRDCADCPDMAEIPATSTEIAGDHTGVVFVETGASEPFALSRREVTFDEWQACVAEGGCRPLADAGWGRGQRPVINVSFEDAQGYITWLSARTGRQYRLPTEAEWVYAAGPAFAEERANAVGANRNRTVPAGSFAPSVYGLYDMRGNVWEWVADCSPAVAGGSDCSRHIVKGGAWNTPAFQIAAEATALKPAAEGGADVGFRVARDLP